jgi:lipopolysaccharide transport system ATP-binding protein
MSDTVIRVENLGKRYIIGHQPTERYTALRDVLMNKAKGLTQLVNPKAKRENPTSEAFWALQDVSFEVKQGDRVGIIGRNGAGKSTLLKILSRITEPTTGRVRIKGRVASLLEVGTGFHPELTGRENIYLNGAILGMSKQEIRRKFDEIVAFAEVERFLDTPVKRYSSGMYVRLAFAVAAHLEPEILIVDEVLAVGDAAFQKKCLGKMEDVAEKEGKTVLFVSHNMGVISSLCNYGVYLNSGKVIHHGLISQTISEYLTYSHDSFTGIPGVIYQKDKTQFREDKFQILRISSLDRETKLSPIIKTGEYVKFRIHYYSPKSVSNASVVLEVNTFSGHKIIQYSTLPLSGFQMSFQEGKSYIDCVIPSLSLSAGTYYISAGLAIPMAEWLCFEKNIAAFEVSTNDIYNSKYPPSQERTILALEHYWEN